MGSRVGFSVEAGGRTASRDEVGGEGGAHGCESLLHVPGHDVVGRR